MQVTCQLHEPGNIAVRITTVMTLMQWEEVSKALSPAGANWELRSPRQAVLLLKQIDRALADFKHTVVRRGKEEGAEGAPTQVL